MSDAQSRLLVLVPEDADTSAFAALSDVDIDAVVVHGLSAYLKRLSEEDWLGTLVSLSADNVDERVVERVARTPGCGALLLSAPGASLDRALLAERVGAVGLVREPLRADDLIERASLLLDEGDELRLPTDAGPVDGGASDGAAAADPIVGEGPAMAHVFERIARVARSDSTVLLTGESGTGKELVARALHAAGPRSRGPFVAVNCAAIPEQLLESELFGHQKGAFTGAVASRSGRFERADGGTLLLDEVGDMSPVLQAKLLRALEERTVEPVGGDGPRPIDVRVVAATHRDLRDRTLDGSFREDLYYRLAVVDIHLPPLRERGPDIRALALHFAGRFARRHGSEVSAITERALERLEAHSWPGNVRELRNVLDRAVLLASGSVLRSGHLRVGEASPRASSRPTAPGPVGYPPELSLAEVEAHHIERVLASTQGHIGRAADVLGIHRNTLTRKVREYGIDVEDEGDGT
ncbi:MAG: sigma-54 dependent transcriptional regulator [Gemmatimonadota bacterium]